MADAPLTEDDVRRIFREEFEALDEAFCREIEADESERRRALREAEH